MGGSGPGKWALVGKIKDMQRSDAEAKAKWWAFCDEHHGGIHDPKKHDKEVLEQFLAANPWEGGGGGENMSAQEKIVSEQERMIKSELVEKIKSMQRSDAEAKKKWWAFTDEQHGGVHDPKKLDKAVLEEFLAANA